MNYPKLWQPVIGLTLAINFLLGCASPPLPTATPLPQPSTNLVNNWRLYVTEVKIGTGAEQTAKFSSYPHEAKAGWHWVALTLRLENMTGSWITLPDGSDISGGVLDSGGNERELVGINFAPYTRLAAGQGIYPGPQFQIEGLAWVDLPQDQTPTDVWLWLDNDENGQVDETLGVNLAESPPPPPLFDSLHMTVNGPGYVFDYGDDLHATVTALRLEPVLDGQVRLRVELELENLSSSVITLDAAQVVQVWGIDQGGHYFCCLADDNGQGGDFGPERKLPPGQTATGFIAATPFYPDSATVPEVLVALTIRSKPNTVTNLFFAKLGDAAVTSGAATPTATELPEPPLQGEPEPTQDTQNEAPPGQGGASPGQPPLVLPFGDRTTLAGLPCTAPTIPYPTATPVLNPDATVEPDEGSLEESPTPSIQEPGPVPATVEPSQPDDSVDAIFIQDQYAYLNLSSNLVILDISNPVQPVAAGSAALPANAPTAAIYVLDHYAYVLAGGLRIFDVSEPTQPTEVGCFSLPMRDWIEYIPMVSPSPPPHRGMDVVARRAETGRIYAYIAAHAAGLRIVDVSDPAAPAEVGSYEFEPTPAVTGIVLSGNLAYLASPDGLRIVDVSQPTQPVEISLFPAISWDVAAAGNRAYLVEGQCSPLDGCDFGSLQVVDVANPAQPVRLVQAPLTYSQVVALSGENIYVATRYGLGIFRQTDLSQSLSFWPQGAAIIITDIAIKDNYLYLAAGRQGLKILNVAEATAPTQAGEFPTAASIAPPPAEPLAGHLTAQSNCAHPYPYPNLQRREGWVDGPQVLSPDGQQVAFSRNPDGDARLYIMNRDGSGQISLDAPNKGIPLADPVWSPDSQYLAFSNISLSQPGGGEIYVVKADGSGLIHLASYLGYYDTLAWSPDSQQIAFTSGIVSGHGSGASVSAYEIYLVNADGSGQLQPVMEGCEPVWQP